MWFALIDVGINEKAVECSGLVVSFWVPLDPRIEIMVVLSIATRNLVLRCLMTSEYHSPLLAAIRTVTLLIKVLHSRSIHPAVENTSGVKVAFSIFTTLQLSSRFFCLSFSMYSEFIVLFW